MSRPTNRLTHRKVETLKTPGRHADGGGLYLHIGKDGSRNWAFIYQWPPGSKAAKRREMGLGPVSDVALAKARDEALKARQLIRDGVDPIEERRRQRAKAEVPLFGAYAAEVVEGLPLGSAKYRKQWKRTLTELLPTLQDTPVNEITAGLLVSALRPHWTRIPETAERLRGRIERVLDAARAAGFINSPWENPARWRGHMEHLLPKAARDVRHHAALPYEDIGAFMAELRAREGVAAAALEWTILTVARTSQTCQARRREVDLDAAVWIAPKEHMKGEEGKRREHRVPLSDAALDVARRAIHEDMQPDDFLFPGLTSGAPLSTGGMDRLLDRMGYQGKITVHGFRSAFQDWAEDCTNFPVSVIEAAMAHVAGDETKRAYRRRDALEKRRKLMDAWAGYCSRPASAKVVPMKRAGG